VRWMTWRAISGMAYRPVAGDRSNINAPPAAPVASAGTEGHSEQALRPTSEHDWHSGRTLIQTRGGGRGDSTSVECSFSITPS